MKLIEQIRELISRGEIKDASTNLLEDTANAVLGDPISIGKIIIALAKSPFFIREQLFWMKMELFLNGVYLSEDDRAKLRAKLTEDGAKQDNSFRLVECIDRAETQQKVQYLINATRCLLTDFIDRPTYFRICHAVTHTLEEDLLFLAEYINKSDLPYSTYTQGLLTSGLMYQSVIDGNGDQKYSFTPLAGIVDQYAVSYENIERYPNPTQSTHNFADPQPKLPGIPKWEEISEIQKEEIENMFKK